MENCFSFQSLYYEQELTKKKENIFSILVWKLQDVWEV